MNGEGAAISLNGFSCSCIYPTVGGVSRVKSPHACNFNISNSAIYSTLSLYPLSLASIVSRSTPSLWLARLQYLLLKSQSKIRKHITMASTEETAPLTTVPSSTTSPPSATVTSYCHCTAISLTFPTPTVPLNSCICSICSRYSALWAYYLPSEVTITPSSGATDLYTWKDKDMEFHRCKTCGCVTHWQPADMVAHQTIAVNCRMLERSVLDGMEVRRSEGPK